MMPTSDRIGISRRLEDEDGAGVASLIPRASHDSGTGYVARTAADGAVEGAQARYRILDRLWHVLRETMKTAAVPSLVWEDLPLHLRTLPGHQSGESLRFSVTMTPLAMRSMPF